MEPCTSENTLKEIQRDTREMRGDIKKLLIETSALKVKSSIWGALGGCIPFIVGLVLYLYGGKK